MSTSTYVLGTGLSHNGSACLLKDGEICAAIEKERLTRKKHDGYNDTEAINYCLKAAGITIKDVALVVQNSPNSDLRCCDTHYAGLRVFNGNEGVPLVTISHHLAHAYSTIGTCPFDEFSMLIIDGMGNSYDACCDLDGAIVPDREVLDRLPQLFFEKDSYYQWTGNQCRTVMKDFSEYGHLMHDYPMHPPNKHSIGAMYGAASRYCLNNLNDLGKLMGLGPYGRPGIYKDEIFDLRDGRIFVKYDWMHAFRDRVRNRSDLDKNFQYYADIAYWVQREVERAILYVVKSRVESNGARNLCYAGGVALNAVANAKILASGLVDNLYMQPAAGDNGVAIGCAYYGWLEVLRRERTAHNRSTCFGISYDDSGIDATVRAYSRALELSFQSAVKSYTPAPARARRCIQFDFGHGRVHSLVIARSGLLRYEEGSAVPATCRVSLDDTTFFQFLFKPELRDVIQKSGAIEVSNPAEFRALVEMVNWNVLSKVVLARLKQESDGRESAAGTPQQRGDASMPVRNADYIKRTAEQLADGKIVGWFQDGSEFGPRALGHRSILADPRRPEVRDFINRHIKLREDFRPFAPAVLREDVFTYFQTGYESPYMLLVDQIRDEWRNRLKSIVHEDGSCRVQTVTPDWNARFYELLREFKKLTGVSVLLNTSFNGRGMPIVETPQDAFQFFLVSRLDVLTIGEYVIEKQPSWMAREDWPLLQAPLRATAEVNPALLAW